MKRGDEAHCEWVKQNSKCAIVKESAAEVSLEYRDKWGPTPFTVRVFIYVFVALVGIMFLARFEAKGKRRGLELTQSVESGAVAASSHVVVRIEDQTRRLVYIHVVPETAPQLILHRSLYTTSPGTVMRISCSCQLRSLRWGRLHGETGIWSQTPYMEKFSYVIRKVPMTGFKKSCSVFLFSIFLAGCASVATQFKQASEPAEDESRARLRIIANSLVKAVPNKGCIDWNTQGAGTVFGGIFGSSGYRGRTLNMPLQFDVKNSGEMYVAAGKPFTLVFMTGPEGISYKGRTYQCSVSGSFIPQENKDYEARLMFEASIKQCVFSLTEIGEKIMPVKIAEASRCD
jgi:hypothetical protein